MSSSRLKYVLMTLEDMNVASSENLEYSENSHHVEIKKLYKLWSNRTAAIASGNYPEEADQIISKLHHENIIPFYSQIGPYNKEDAGRLDAYLKEEKNRRNFTWAQRLRTCIGVAKGLSYLHSGIGDHGRVIHGDVTSRNVLLNKNLEAKIIDLYGSVLVRANQPRPELYRPTPSLCSSDPVYLESKILNIESDIYSYGILMFAILTGMKDAYRSRAIGDYKEQKLINLVLRYHDNGPEHLIDPYIVDNVDRRSFHMFIETAYKCISFNIKDRPTMDEIVKTIEEALDIHNQQSVSAIAKRRNPADSLENFRISLEEIHKATKNLSEETEIRKGDVKVIYKGHFSDLLQKPTAAIKIYRPRGYQQFQFHGVRFRAEFEIVSMLHHENIAPFIGYCDEICAIVSEYAVNGSLDSILKDPNKSITWTQRLKICIGVAKGLRYLHSGFGDYQRVIHGDFGSRKILLYANLEAKIWGFSNSFLFPGYRRNNDPDLGTVDDYYMDPVYRQSEICNKESDVYSYGVVLFEILTGMLASETRSIGDEDPLNLVALVRRYYAEQLDKLLDPRIRDEIDDQSLYTFKEIAYKCISFNVKDRPSLNKIIKRLEEALYIQNKGAGSNNTGRFKKLEDSRIPLKDIDLAIGVKGPETQIGDGGFGVVYKGQPSERWQNRTVAIKCLRPESYQGEYEFRNELNMIFSFNHENIIPYIGYCDEGNEKIIVYEFASNGSLDCHLKDKDKRRFLTLNGEHRLKICLGAARGLDYLHSGLGEDNKVIHRDVKSANILLDHNLVAKVCDFGLSKSGLVNQLQTQVYTNAAGTNFYMDPVYHESGVLRKESDVYSFGVVMFELLNGFLGVWRIVLAFWFLVFGSVWSILSASLFGVGLVGSSQVIFVWSAQFPSAIFQFSAVWHFGYSQLQNRMLKLRASQEGLEVRMTDDEIMDKVLGTSRGFKPGRGRKLPNNSSSSSVRSYTAPPPSASQAGLEKFVEKFVVAHNEQVKDILSQLADKNTELRLHVPLNPNQFMDDVIDEGDESDDLEDAAESEEE
ncbi:protein kinase, ATP binding site-containing protein [Tanacetum coccineum]